MIKYGSVCSGIEACSFAWHDLGWQPQFFSEISEFPRAVLKHRFPDVPLHGDFTTIEADTYGAIDLLVGGTPCQAFSVAGLRGGLADERGNLTLEFVRLADRLRPRWVLWENVPGVLSIDDGRAFGSLLGGLAKLGYGFAYCILDAQYFGVPQQRQRVFVVGYHGDWRPPAAVLFESSGLSGFSPPRRTKKENRATETQSDPGTDSIELVSMDDAPSWPPAKAAAYTTRVHAMTNQELGGEFSAFLPVDESGEWPPGATGALPTRPLVNQNIQGNGGPFLPVEERRKWPPDVTGAFNQGSGTGAGQEILTNGGSFLPVMGASQGDVVVDRDGVSPTLRTVRGGASSGASAVVEVEDEAGPVRGLGYQGDTVAQEDGVAPTVPAGGGNNGGGGGAVLMATDGTMLRRFTPIEAERLQGFPDDWTNVPWRGKPTSPMTKRYHAVGNSMATPVMRWLGERIQMVDDLIEEGIGS